MRDKHQDHSKTLTTDPDDVFLTEGQLADRHQKSAKTLRNARVRGGYVKFCKLGGSIRYRLSDVIEYEDQHAMLSTSEDKLKS